jgi:hypothetical protein
VRRAALLATLVLAACASRGASPPAIPAPVAAGASSPAALRLTAEAAPAPARVCRHPIPAACDGPPIAYARDVLPLLEKRCFSCHTGNGVAADEHDFSRMDTLLGERAQVTDEVSTCAMPPRSRLVDDEASLLLRWVACGQRTDR